MLFDCKICWVCHIIFITFFQSLVHDILLTIIDMTEPPVFSGSSYTHVIVLRDLSTSLSACIYESLCDSDNFVVKQGGARGLSMEELIRFLTICFLIS